MRDRFPSFPRTKYERFKARQTVNKMVLIEKKKYSSFKEAYLFFEIDINSRSNPTLPCKIQHT